MPNHNVFHIIISPSGDYDKEVFEEELENYIVNNTESYIFSRERGDNGKLHLHIGIILKKARRQDKLRESLLKFMNFNKHTIPGIGLVVKTHWDFDYLVGYLFKEGKPHLKSFDNKEFEKKCIEKYGTGKGDYFGEKKKKIDTWGYDKIIINFAQFCVEQKLTMFNHDAWDSFLEENIKDILPSTHARIRKESTIEWVNAYIKNKLKGGDRNGVLTKGLTPLSLVKIKSNNVGRKRRGSVDIDRDRIAE